MYIKWQRVSAFAAGAVLASGIVYFSVRPTDTVPDLVKTPAPKAEARKPQVVPKAPVAVAKTEIPSAPPSVAAPKPVHVQVREKPSPMPPPVRHDKPAIARYEPPVMPGTSEAKPSSAPVEPEPKPVENVPAKNVLLPAPVTQTRVAPSVTLRAGEVLAVRIGQPLSSALNQPGDSFVATLTEPLIVDGWVIAERGARAEGRIVDAEPAGRVKGVAHLEISIVRVALSDGQSIRIRTEPYVRDGSAGLIGIFARKAAEIPVDSRLGFRLLDSIAITERVN